MRSALVTLCFAALVAACGASTSTSPSTSTVTATNQSPSPPANTAPPVQSVTTAASTKTANARPAAAATATIVKAVSSQYGHIVADARGQAFYLFGKEDSGRTECYGACATRWPPVLVKGQPAAGPGAQSRLLGTTRRHGGRLQLTYAGHPIYYYAGDSPGRVLCQAANEFGGLWLVLRPSGKPVT